MTTLTFVESCQKEIINHVNQLLNEITRQVDGTNENEKALAQQARGREGSVWWEAPIEQLKPSELEELHSRYAEFVKGLYITRSKKFAKGYCITMVVLMQPFF
ncbi:hypothetical protein V6N13_087825 [Hibiscus sabdariffa]|uniref:Uncharacterized protein n=1 Tax=Hibiscus sabdariffa TaxID=183260 RepID=A0ABR2FYB1_9ROSI